MARSAVTLPALKKTGVEGIRELRATVAHVLDRTELIALKEVFFGAGMVLYNKLQAVAPGPSKGNKKFPAGTLRSGIFISGGKQGKPNVLVGIGWKGRANYLAIWQEYGTYKYPARPFFRPAVVSCRAEMADIIANGIKDAMDKAVEEGRA